MIPPRECLGREGPQVERTSENILVKRRNRAKRTWEKTARGIGGMGES